MQSADICIARMAGNGNLYKRWLAPRLQFKFLPLSQLNSQEGKPGPNWLPASHKCDEHCGISMTLCCCKSKWTSAIGDRRGTTQTITIRRIRPLDHLEGPAICKWSSRGSGHLQMIIWRDQPLANDHLEDPASCKWSSGGTGHLQMISQMILPLANDHSEDLASCKWSSGGMGPLQMIIRHPCHPSHLCQDQDLISGTFLKQFVLVLPLELFK